MAAYERLDHASEADARELLIASCGSSLWVERMLAHRPFASDENLFTLARQEWFALTPDDWREAFRHHPRIGDRQSLRARFPHTAHLSEEEQRGVWGAPDETLDELARLNRAYEEKFGYIFIVCAAGKTADEMLAMLRDRLNNDAHEELLIAAGEQAKIIEKRLIG